MKHDLLAKSFQFLLYRRSSIHQDIYFLCRIRRFVIFQSSPTRAIKKIVALVTEDKPYAHLKTHLHAKKVYYTLPVSLTIEVLLIKIVLFFDH